MNLGECNVSSGNKIEFRATLPVRQKPIDIRFGTLTTMDLSQTLLERCFVTLEPGEYNISAHISVQAICDNIDRDYAPEWFGFTVTTTDNAFWTFGYELPSVLVSLSLQSDICV